MRGGLPTLSPCELCGGAGVVQDDATGESIDCLCRIVCERQLLSERLSRYDRFPYEFRDVTFTSFEQRGNAGQWQTMLDAIRGLEGWVDDLLDSEQGRWQVLLGAVGCGKSMLAAAARNALMSAPIPVPVLWVSVHRLINMSFEALGNGGPGELLELAEAAPVLVLDDLGATDREITSAYALGILECVVHNRSEWSVLRPTLVTSNLAVPALRERYPRTASRVLDRYKSDVYGIKTGDDRWK